MSGVVRLEGSVELGVLLAEERERLVRLCAYLSGDVEAAEDLAQETLLEAWRHVDRLYDESGYAQWLSAIARNVCLRWRRYHGREMARRLPSSAYCRPERPGIHEMLTDDVDLQVDLERDELADLLDRALDLLPDQTRDAMLRRYVAESSYADIAERLGLSEGAVAVRLHRGKMALRRVLSTDLRDEAVWYGLADAGDDTWQETRIWCRACGQRRLSGRFDTSTGELVLRCPDCCAAPDAVVTHVTRPDLFHGIKGYKAALSRLMAWHDNHYRQALQSGVVPCCRCHQLVPIRLGVLQEVPPILHGQRGVEVRCSACGTSEKTLLSTLALSLPEGRRFWREHPRIRILPDREIEASGQDAVVVGFESVTDATHFEVVYNRDSYQPLKTHV